MNMDIDTPTKPWWQSKTVWGGVVALAAGVAGVFGVAIPEAAQGEIAVSLTALAGAIGGLLSIYGRLKAERKLK